MSVELVPCDAALLPVFSSGAHLDLLLPNGLVRSYSLINSEHERDRYVIAILKATGSRGGSRWLHENLRVGMRLRIRSPRNHFALREQGAEHVLIAGGIGITPFLSMLPRLNALRHRWTLHYCVRSSACAAFSATLRSLAAVGYGTVVFHVPDAADSSRLDMEATVNSVPTGAHLYCCGPSRMLEAFRATAAFSHTSEHIHWEHFGGPVSPVVGKAFTVVLARSHARVPVAAGETVLEALQAVGVSVPHACLEGVCGSCETRVLAGLPDHRDLVLSPEERRSNSSMMVCVSRALSAELILDL